MSARDKQQHENIAEKQLKSGHGLWGRRANNWTPHENRAHLKWNSRLPLINPMQLPGRDTRLRSLCSVHYNRADRPSSYTSFYLNGTHRTVKGWQRLTKTFCVTTTEVLPCCVHESKLFENCQPSQCTSLSTKLHTRWSLNRSNSCLLKTSRTVEHLKQCGGDKWSEHSALLMELIRIVKYCHGPIHPKWWVKAIEQVNLGLDKLKSWQSGEKSIKLKQNQSNEERANWQGA